MSKYIFFIHGYSSNSKKTWGKFLDFLNDNLLVKYDIDCLDYKSPSKWKFWESAPSLFNVAEALISNLERKCDIENDEVVLIGHSNGGVVIKKILQRLFLKGISHNISRVIFLDVPHHGSGLATVGKIVNPRNQHLKSLPLNSTDLLEINDHWIRSSGNLNLEVLNLVAEDDDAVAAMSSRFNTPDSITISGTNHSSIAKPASPDEEVVLEVLKFINNKRSLNKYKNLASQAYKDWRRFDRHHTLDYVADDLRKEAYDLLCSELDGQIPLVRLTGLSGLGKSRLLVEYINNAALTEEEILVFDAPKFPDAVLESVKNAVDDQRTGLVVIENCDVKLHDKLRKLFPCESNELKIVTVNFYHEKVQNTGHIKLEKLASSETIALIKSILTDKSESDLHKIAKFVEGFPLLVDLITTQLLEDGSITTNLSESDLVEKLINGDGEITPEQREYLKVFSLFDSFHFQDDSDTSTEVIDFICKVAKAGRLDFDSTITKYRSREIINCSDRFARVVPKPLALNLAMDWWNGSLFQRQNELISGLPPSLLDSFGRQIVYLDGSIKVQSFVDTFMESTHPFGQAELLLSNKGSKLFRSLVEVNPKATSNALFRVFKQLSDEDIDDIAGDVRREIVWALEMLCWHRNYFYKSAWCLLKLACFEKESYSNNATGQFSQIFRWRNSGTEADFTQRIELLNDVIALNSKKADLVAIEAIKQAISTYGGTRTLGSEKQGTKPEMKEWMPEKWQQVFDYWDAMIEYLLSFLVKPYAAELVKNTIGNEIRGMVSIGTTDILDKAITTIISAHGKYWPSAIQSINHALEYDSEKMPDEVNSALLKWQKLFSPSDENLQEKILLIVLDPSREYQRNDENELVDVAALDAIEFAHEIENIEDLSQYFEYILSFHQQKQSWIFGKEIIGRIESINRDVFFSYLLECLGKIENSRFQFVAGCLTGLYAIDPSIWASTLDRFTQNDNVKSFYPDALCTGTFNIEQLMKVITLISDGVKESENAAIFCYGRATHHLKEEEVVEFCAQLSEVDYQGVWVSLDIMNMYMHGRKNFDFKKIKPLIVNLLLKVSFEKKHKVRHHDGYHWLKRVEKILNSGDQEFGLKLIRRLMDQVSESNVDISDLWDNLQPAFYSAFKSNVDGIWPFLSQYILKLEERTFFNGIDELLGCGIGSRKGNKSIFNLVDEELIVEWCKNEKALLIVARSLTLLEDSEPNSLLIKIIEKYGNNKNLNSEIIAKYHTRSWTGSLVPYLETDKKIIMQLEEHHSKSVRDWASQFVSMLDHDIETNSKRDSDESFVRGW